MTKRLGSMKDLPAPSAAEYERSGKRRWQGRWFCPRADCSLRQTYGTCKGHKDGLSNFPSRTAALAAARKRQEHELELWRRESGAHEGDSRTTLGQVAEMFLASDGGRAGESTMTWYAQLWNAWTVGSDGHVPRGAHIPAIAVGDVTPPMVHGWLMRLREAGLSQSTIRSHLMLIRRILKYAVTLGHISANPIADLDPPTALGKKSVARQRIDDTNWSESDVWRLHDAIRVEYRPVILLMGFCGLRIEEVVALRPDDFFREGTALMIEVRRQWNRRTNNFTQPKRGKERVVAVPPLIHDRLWKWLADLPNRDRQVNLVITSPMGNMLRYDNFRRDWYRALQRAGLRRAGTHELRRHAASWMINVWGMAITDVADMLGNTPEVLERHYRKDQTPARLAAAVSHITNRQADVIRRALGAAAMLALGSGQLIDTQTGQLIEVIDAN